MRLAFFFLLAVILSGTVLADDRLENIYSISLNEKDRVLGSLKGNFAVYGRPYIAMYDHLGSKLWSRRLKNNVKPYLSPSGQYLALATYADHSPTDLKTTKLEFFKSDGSLLWRIAKPASTRFYIADNGAVVGIEGVPGIPPTNLHLYGLSGDHLTAISLEDFHGLVFSPSGRKFIVDVGGERLVAYNTEGERLFELPPADYFIFADNEDYAATFTGGVLDLYRGDERVSRVRFPQPEIVDMKLDIEDAVMIIVGRKRLAVHEPLSGNFIREFNLSEKNKSFTSIDLSDDGGTYICGIDVNNGKAIPKSQRHTEGYIYIFLDNGKDLARHKETYKDWRVGLPRVVISPTDNTIMMETAESIKKLNLP